MDILPQDNTPYKRCSNPECLKWLPATPEFFHRDKKLRDGLCNRCKECVCRKLKEYRSIPEIRERERAKNRTYYQTYYQRPGVLEHREANNRARYHRPDIIEQARAYNTAYHRQPERREHRRIYNKVYFSRPESRIRSRVRSLTRIARKKAVQGSYTHAQIQEQLKRQRYRCYYAACGHAKFEKKNGKHVYHVEHTFPISRVVGTDIPANDMSYLVLACPFCNLSKSEKFPWEWPEGGRLL